MVANLLAQKKAVGRAAREVERRRQEEEVRGRDRGAEEEGKAVREFEMVVGGWEGMQGGKGRREGNAGQLALVHDERMERRIRGEKEVREIGKNADENEVENAVQARGNEKEKVNGNDKPEQLGIKRKFELDQESMLENVKADRARARRALDEEKVCFSLNIRTHGSS